MNDVPQPGGSGPPIETVLGLGKSRTSGLLRRWRGRIAAAVILVAAVAAYALWNAGGPANGLRYVTEKASTADLTVLVTATGSVQPTVKVEVSSELSGIIRRVLVDYNSTVKIGQPLAELDTEKLQATVDSARAKLAAAEAKVTEARATIEQTKLDYERRKALVAKNVTSSRDLETAKAAYDRALASLASARADVSAAKADLKLQETNLSKACICSPINGVVLMRNVEPGQTVATSFQAPVLFTIAEDLRKMDVQVDVDEADVGKVRKGQQATFTVDAYPDRKFTAVIRELRLGPEVVQGVVTYKAVLSADNSEMLLRPGMTATAEIVVQQVKSALTVPNAALRYAPPRPQSGEQGGGLLSRLLPGRPRFRAPSKPQGEGPRQKIWVLRDGAPVAVPVTVGATDGKRTQIVAGDIKPGEPVIVDTVKRSG